MIQPAHAGGLRATLGRPGVAGFLSDLADAGVVHVAADHHVGVALGVHQDGAELVAPGPWCQAGHGSEVDRVDPHQGLIHPDSRRGCHSLRADDAGQMG